MDQNAGVAQFGWQVVCLHGVRVEGDQVAERADFAVFPARHGDWGTVVARDWQFAGE